MNKNPARSGMLGLVLFSVSASPAAAELRIQGPAEFQQRVTHYLAEAKNLTLHLERLIDALESTPVRVTIQPISEDPETWHHDGERTRSHTRALDSGKRGANRSRPTASIVYLNPERVDPGHRSYNAGTLVHELVHALDLARGLYHADYRIREKRAVFFQNIWRQQRNRKLRRDYHGRFATTEYQAARQTGGVDAFVDYYFRFDDMP